MRRSMMRPTCLLMSALIVLAAWAWPAEAGERGLLWRVVQTCVLNHDLTGASFPCLSVETPKGVESGYAVLRAPNEAIRVVLSPTVRTAGIEAERLRGTDAPNYFHDAWMARHFVIDDLARTPSRGDLALAVNSKLGRSQDQLHIHVACIRPTVKHMLARAKASSQSANWTRIKVLPSAPYYWAHFEPSRDLSGLNLFDRVAAGLNVDPDDMDDVTIVVVGVEPSGFIVLARKKIPHVSDEPHGEGLLDPNCSGFKRP